MNACEQVENETAAARLLGMSVSTLRRLGADGPLRVRLSERRVGYRRSDLLAWLESRTCKAA